VTDTQEDRARRLAEASAWRLHLSEQDVESTPAFEGWLADEANQAAWRRLSATWTLFDDHTTNPDILRLRHGALKDVHRFSRLRRPFPVRASLTGAAAVIAIAFGVTMWLNQSQAFATGPGERRTVLLEDGSRVTLDANTRLRVAFSFGMRNVELSAGQARFKVAHDRSRPFVVTAGRERVTAIGTDFDIDLPGNRTFVTLIEGRVRADGGGKSAVLEPGEQLVAVDTGPPRIARVDIGAVTAWESGQLVFDETPLEDAVARISRYGGVAVRVADAKSAAMPVSGVFRTDDVEGFVTTVTHYLPVTARRDDAGVIWLQAKPVLN